MFDLGSLSNIVSIATGIGGFLITIIGAYWQWVIKPNNAFKARVIEDIAKLQTDHIEDVKKLQEFKQDVARTNEDLEKDLLRDVDNVRRDQENFVDDVKDRFNRVDAKNEKLLDLIIKYFSENN